MTVLVLWAVEDAPCVYEEHLLGIFPTPAAAWAFWSSLTDAAREGYRPMLEERTLGLGLVPCLSQTAIARSGREGC